MSRHFLTLLCAFSVAAVAVAQDDDLDALLAGLGDEDMYSDAPAETTVVEAEDFSAFFDAGDTAAAQEAVQDAADDFAAIADDFAEASEDFAEAAAEIPQEAAEAMAEDDPFADFFDEATAEEAVVEEAVAEEAATDFAEAADAFAEAADDFAEAADEMPQEAADAAAEDDLFAGFFEEAVAEEAVAEEAADFAEAAADAAEDIPEAAEAAQAEIADAFGDEPFADFFEDVPAEEPAPAEETAAAPEAIPEPAQAATPVAPIAPDFPAEESVEDFANLFADSGSFPEEPAPAEDTAAAEVSPADDSATVAEAEAAAVIIRKNRNQPSDKPAKGKKDKFSSAARKPIKSGSATPSWDEPVTFDTSAEPAPAVSHSPKAASSSSADWNQPVLW